MKRPILLDFDIIVSEIRYNQKQKRIAWDFILFAILFALYSLKIVFVYSIPFQVNLTTILNHLFTFCHIVPFNWGASHFSRIYMAQKKCFEYWNDILLHFYTNFRL